MEKRKSLYDSVKGNSPETSRTSEKDLMKKKSKSTPTGKKRKSGDRFTENKSLRKGLVG